MKQNQEVLIKDLSIITDEVLLRAQSLLGLSKEEINWKPYPASWSIAECLEHLNRYGDFYLPACRESIEKLPKVRNNQKPFKSGLLGNYFAKLMFPKEGGKTMQSPKDKNPIHSMVSENVLDTFITQQKEIIDILASAGKIDLNKGKTSISISNMIKLKLGDTLRVVIYHNLRHIKQIEKILEAIRASR